MPVTPLSPYATPAHILIKPAGPDCNLRCKYCFYTEKHALFAKNGPCRMPDIILEQCIRSYLASQPTREVEFAWQGGEPTLLGVAFFQRALELQKKYGEGRIISNSIQTNGTMLDDAWCEFLARERFLVGISVDGPRPIHNRYRVSADGNGSFDKVMKAVQCMRKHGVEFNALTCVTRESAAEGRQIYRFLREAGFKFMQFIPIVERHPDPIAGRIGLSLAAPPDIASQEQSAGVMPFTVESGAYGQFLITVFDEWIKHDVGRIFVNHFDVALGAWTGAPPSLCVNSRICGAALAIEHDGSVYACDHFVYPDFLRGNLMTDDLGRILGCMPQRAFGMQKALALTEACKQCRHLKVCNGGCMKHRFDKSASGQPGHNYLCAGYMRFYDHIAPYMEEMARMLSQNRPPSDIMKALPRLIKAKP
jgi:uncharacterized protein